MLCACRALWWTWDGRVWCCAESCSSAMKGVAPGVGVQMSERGSSPLCFVPAQLGSEREVLVTLEAPGELQPSGVLCTETVPTRGVFGASRRYGETTSAFGSRGSLQKVYSGEILTLVQVGGFS